MDFIYGIYSEKGNREENQDSTMHLLKNGMKAFAVADGLGGLQYGGEASRVSIKAFQDELNTLDDYSCDEVFDVVKRKFNQINKHIFDICLNKEIRMATTLSIIVIINNTYLLGNVGDTIIYQIRNNTIKILSRLHSLAYDEHNKLRKHDVKSQKHVLTMAIGGEAEIDPFFASGIVKRNDIYIICSDGLYNHLSESEILEYIYSIRHESNDDMTKICQRFVDQALKNGSMDNLSIVAVKAL